MREPAVGSALIGAHVLVVDADAEMRDLLEAVLTYCGALVTSAASAADAVLLVTRYRPDVVVADAGLAECGELVKQLRGAGGSPTIPVVGLLSGRDSADRLLSAGFSAHLRKPVDPWALCRMLVSLTRPA